MNMKEITPIATHVAALGAALLLLAGCGKTPESKPESAAATPAPFTGEVHEIKMRGTVTSFFFEPKQLIIKRGDKVRFTMVDGGPHNVNFTGQQIPKGANVILENEGKLLGVMLQAPGQTCEVEFHKKLPVGDYHFVCDPHAALGMTGKITVVF